MAGEWEGVTRPMLINQLKVGLRMLEANPQNQGVGSALMKLVLRKGLPASEIGKIVLTGIEEKALIGLLGTGAKFLIKMGSRLALVGVLAQTVVGVITGDGADRSLGDRFEIVMAHLAKGSGPLVLAFAAIEQATFAVLDTLFPGVPVMEIVTDVATALFGPPEISARQGMAINEFNAFITATPQPTDFHTGVAGNPIVGNPVLSQSPIRSTNAGGTAPTIVTIPKRERGHLIFAKIDP